MAGAMRVCFAMTALALAFFVTAVSAGNVSGTIYGTIGTGGVSGVGGSIEVGTGDHPEDDPAPPMTTPPTPGQLGPNGVDFPQPPSAPDPTGPSHPTPDHIPGE